MAFHRVEPRRSRGTDRLGKLSSVHRNPRFAENRILPPRSCAICYPDPVRNTTKAQTHVRRFRRNDPGAIEFFERLKADNTKAFYESHKVFYRDEIKKPAELMGDLFAEDLARLTGKPHVSKVFRIHRDVRFSKDKTPYNTHLHLLWSRPATQ
jgi:hypothetical protein